MQLGGSPCADMPPHIQVSAIDFCFREPVGRNQCAKIQGELGEEPSSGQSRKLLQSSLCVIGCIHLIHIGTHDCLKRDPHYVLVKLPSCCRLPGEDILWLLNTPLPSERVPGAQQAPAVKQAPEEHHSCCCHANEALQGVEPGLLAGL